MGDMYSEDAAVVLLRGNLAGCRRGQRLSRRRMPLQLALPLLLLLFLLLEFFLPLLKLKVRFCQRITFRAENLSACRRGRVGHDSDYGTAGEAHCRVIAFTAASDFQTDEPAFVGSSDGVPVSPPGWLAAPARSVHTSSSTARSARTTGSCSCDCR
jgi:hypothetical protein